MTAKLTLPAWVLRMEFLKKSDFLIRILKFRTSVVCFRHCRVDSPQTRSAAWVPALGYSFMYFRDRLSKAKKNKVFFKS